MATGAKSIETRNWPTSYRGPLLICASKRRVLRDLWDDLDCSSFQQGLERLFKENRRVLPEDLNFGHAVALVDLVDCVPTGDLQADDQIGTDAPFGNFAPGRFGFVARRLRRIRPFPVRGERGFFSVELPGDLADWGAAESRRRPTGGGGQ
jgi:hypothetical protein